VKTEYDIWYETFQLEIDGEPTSPPKTATQNDPWDEYYICPHEENLHVWNQLALGTFVDYNKTDVVLSFYKVSKLELSKPPTSLSSSQLETLMDPATPVRMCNAGKLSMTDFLFHYGILTLAKLSDKELQKEFMSLRKKYNVNKRIELKLKKHMKLQKAEEDKYRNRYKTAFLYERIMHFDKFYMNGEFKFKNTYKPKI